MKQVINYITPAITPLLPNGKVDYASCERLYNYLIDGGVNGVLLLGSSGEFFGISMEEKKELIDFAVKCIDKRVELVVGTTSMILDEIVELSDYALKASADAVMVIMPYYFHFDDGSVFDYYDELAQRIDGRLYIYNYPDRTGYTISPAVVRALAEKHENIVGIKDTISGVDHTREVIKAVRDVRPDFLVYSGFDDNFVHNVLCGGNGCMAAMSNLYPQLTTAWTMAARNGDYDQLQEIQQKINKIMDVYAVGKPFVPFIKEAMVMKHIIDYAVSTKPMSAANEEQKARIREILDWYEKG